MGFFDNHNHSQFSFDGKKTTVEESAAAAFAKGLDGICFTDHCDFYVPPMKAQFEHLVPEVFDVESQQAEIDRVNAASYAALPGNRRFRILKGIEIGLQKKCREQIREHLGKYRFDQVIASVHYIDGTDPFYGGYYEGKDWKEAYGHYLETIYEEMTWLGDFDIVGHYDYVARYAPYPQASIFYRDFSDIFDAMFKYLAIQGLPRQDSRDGHRRTQALQGARGRGCQPGVRLARRAEDRGQFPALRGRRPQRRVQVSCPFRVQTAPHDSAVMLTGTAGRPAAERAQGMSGYKKRGLQSSFFCILKRSAIIPRYRPLRRLLPHQVYPCL